MQINYLSIIIAMLGCFFVFYLLFYSINKAKRIKKEKRKEKLLENQKNILKSIKRNKQ